MFKDVSCDVSAAVELEYSLDLGLSWQPLVRECLPTSPDCSSYTLQRLLLSDTYNKWGRVTLPISPHARLAKCRSFSETEINQKTFQLIVS